MDPTKEHWSNVLAPKKKIGYLKTHKCASTSIQNILLRYAIRNNLSVLLPAAGGNIFGYDKLFSRKMLTWEASYWKKEHISYHMFLCHARWNHNEISYVLNDTGENDVFYFSFLRDPVELFRSYWDYNAFDVKFCPLHDFISDRVGKDFKNKTGYIWESGGYNQMLYDFGLEYKDMNDVKKVKMKIKEISKTFDLILLADKEYFDDSIILLKNSTHWEYKDMVNFKLNSRRPSNKSKLSNPERNILRSK